jgi:ParB family chromosome partitioning protein
MAKATKKQALGRGLSALLQDTPTINSATDKNADKLVGSILEIRLDFIAVNPFQPRTYFDEEALRIGKFYKRVGCNSTHYSEKARRK